MRTVALKTADGRLIAHEVSMAESFRARFVGLLGSRSLSPRRGLLLSPARCIHTAGMRYAIDVVFLSPRMRILELAASVQPWRIRFAPSGTGRVLELAAGQIAATGLSAGMYILVEEAGELGPVRTGARHGVALKGPCERLQPRFTLRLPLQCAARTPQQCSAPDETVVASPAGHGREGADYPNTRDAR